MNLRIPIYIVSKGRPDSRLTSKALEEMGVDYSIVVEEQEFDDYAAVIDEKKIIILDKKYQRDYETFDKLRDSKSKGPGPARNFVWDHSIESGAKWHWVMDDNLRGFYRLNKNQKHKSKSGGIFKAMEDFVLRYSNIAMAGPNYNCFAKQRQKLPAFIANTRIYSCNLIRNDTPFRWRGRYNEDTDLSLRMLKAGWATIQFNAFLQNKMVTQALKGGNTKEFYEKEGTNPKSTMLANMHPDVTRVVHKFGRTHHHVDYRPFKNNNPRLKKNIKIKKFVDNYGMNLKKIPPIKRAA